MRDPHQLAQELSASADLARSQGKWEEARTLFGEAADLERDALIALPPDRPKSRGILAVSHAALLFKAGLYDRAEAAIHGFLAENHFVGPAREQLRELLPIVWEERSLQAEGLKDSGAEIQIALRGGRVGWATAPAEIAVRYLGGFHSLAYRVAESEAGFPLRRQGAPLREIQEILQARATQPVGGSYRFSLKLLDAAQGELFPERAATHLPDARRVSDTVIRVMRAIATHDPVAFEKAVPSQEYRLALARLARNVVPSGDGVGEVEIRSAEDGPLGAVRLVPGVRRNVNEAIRALAPAPEPEDREETLSGILRAVHLDNHWLKILLDDGSAVKVKTNPDELDDVVGPMVNRKVAARVSTLRGNARLLDIELQED